MVFGLPEDLPENVMTLSQKPMDLKEFFEFFGWHVINLRMSARLFTTFVEVDDLPLQLTMQLGMTCGLLGLGWYHSGFRL